jgi:protein SCO1
MTVKNSNKKFLMGIAVAVLLPLCFYLIVDKASQGKVKMPKFFGIERVDTVQANGKTRLDTIYHQVSELELTNQLGEKVSLNKDLKGKILVVNTFFTTCPTICPRLTSHMLLLETSFKKDRKKEASLDTVVHFVSITVDPKRDSFPALRVYADRHGANHDHWWFLTGDKKVIYNFIRDDLGLATGPGDGGAEDFIHSSSFVLIDKDRYVRGYYNGLNDTDVRKCADDIVLLTLEKKKKKG